MRSRASQNKIELAHLLTEVGKIDPHVIVEIGVHQGYSLETWKKTWPGALVIGIENDIHALDPEAITGCQVIEADSHETNTQYKLLSKLHGQLIDFLFIDGDHTYEGVKRDYQLYASLVRAGGIVGFHDIALDGEKWRNSGVEVKRFWDELTSSRKGQSIIFYDEASQGTGTGVIYI